MKRTDYFAIYENDRLRATAAIDSTDPNRLLYITEMVAKEYTGGCIETKPISKKFYEHSKFLKETGAIL